MSASAGHLLSACQTVDKSAMTPVLHRAVAAFMHPTGWQCTVCQVALSTCRDIKLENTLLERVQPGRNPLIKICDFGYSIDDQSSLPKTKVGTPGYTGEAAVLRQRCSYPSMMPLQPSDPSSPSASWLGNCVSALVEMRTRV